MPRKELVQAERWYRENLLAQELLKRSHLDEKTLKPMLYHSQSENTTFEEIAGALRIQQPGAWKRWRRGQELVKRSFYTIELAIYAGVLDVETAEHIVDDLVDYISLVRGQGNVDELRDRIERRMVELAKEALRKR